jgi:hypothetical protein
MATPEQLLNLRLLIAEPDETTYPEDLLDTRVDAAGGNLDKVAYAVWVEKAASLAVLADISEGGSSRSNNALQDKALKMVALFKAKIDEADAAAGVTTSGFQIHRLVR